MAVRITRGSSRLTHADLLVADGIEFWGRPGIPDLPPSSTDTPHIVEEGQRLEHISQIHYNRSDWDWVIAHRNNLQMFTGVAVPGTVLQITDAAVVREVLF